MLYCWSKAGLKKNNSKIIFKPLLIFFTVISFLSPCGCRKTVQKGKLMDFTSTVIIPLLFGSLGIFALFRLLQWVRMRAYLQEAVVVITGATSGLGKGMDTKQGTKHGAVAGAALGIKQQRAGSSFVLSFEKRGSNLCQNHSQGRFGCKKVSAFVTENFNHAV